MSNIDVNVVGQSAVVTNSEPIYSGDVNTDTVTFHFSDCWDGFGKTAIFYKQKDEVYQVLLNADNTCVIPAEVLASNCCIYIGVYGVKGDQVLTSEVVKYKILTGAICEDITIEAPTLDIYAQIVSQYGAILSAQDSFLEQANATLEDIEEALAEAELKVVSMDGGYPDSEY